MSTAVRSILGLAIGFAAGAAAPPPPVPVPSEFARTIEGYEIGPFYSAWMFWVQGRKHAAFQAMLENPTEIEGDDVRHQPIIEYSWNNDFGSYLAGDVYAYCRFDDQYRVIAHSCHYLLRQVRNDHETDRTEDPLAIWARQSFDPAAIARRLREIHWTPGTPVYAENLESVFAALPSPIPTLTQGSTLVQVDSRQCPAMARAVEALDRREISWRTDMTWVGRDGRSEGVAPHSGYAVYKTTIRVPGGEVTLEGAGAALHGLVGPVVRAANACLEAAVEGGNRR